VSLLNVAYLELRKDSPLSYTFAQLKNIRLG
jgi:hypothetical protein